MHKRDHRSFILDNGDNSVEALNAVTEKPNLKLASYFAHNWILDLSELAPLVTNAKFVADAFDKFVPFYSLCFAFQT